MQLKVIKIFDQTPCTTYALTRAHVLNTTYHQRMQIRNLRDIVHHGGFSFKEVDSSADEDLKQLEYPLINNGPSRWHRHLENDLQFLYSKAYFGVLNRNVPHKLVFECLAHREWHC